MKRKLFVISTLLILIAAFSGIAKAQKVMEGTEEQLAGDVQQVLPDQKYLLEITFDIPQSVEQIKQLMEAKSITLKSLIYTWGDHKGWYFLREKQTSKEAISDFQIQMKKFLESMIARNCPTNYENRSISAAEWELAQQSRFRLIEEFEFQLDDFNKQGLMLSGISLTGKGNELRQYVSSRPEFQELKYYYVLGEITTKEPNMIQSEYSREIDSVQDEPYPNDPWKFSPQTGSLEYNTDNADNRYFLSEFQWTDTSGFDSTHIGYEHDIIIWSPLDKYVTANSQGMFSNLPCAYIDTPFMDKESHFTLGSACATDLKILTTYYTHIPVDVIDDNGGPTTGDIQAQLSSWADDPFEKNFCDNNGNTPENCLFADQIYTIGDAPQKHGSMYYNSSGAYLNFPFDHRSSFNYYWDKDFNPDSFPCYVGKFKGKYFNMKTGNLLYIKYDPEIDFDWGKGGPGIGLENDKFRIEWSGRFNFDAGNYSFIARADDGIRVWLDDEMIIDAWKNQQATEYLVNKCVENGEHAIEVEYYEDNGYAVAQFRWEKKNDPPNPDCYTGLGADGLPDLQWPLEGQKDDYKWYSGKWDYVWKFNSCGSQYKRHVGLDLSLKSGDIKGKKVFAAYDGYIKAKYFLKGWLNAITIEHLDNNDNKFTTNYEHIEVAKGIKENQYVTKGTLIGNVADLKISGDHLHFSIRRAPYSNTSNRGALPVVNEKDCKCGGDPVFPEYFIDPSTASYEVKTGSVHGRLLVANSPTVKPIVGATVTCGGKSTKTSAKGFYTISGILPGEQDIEFTREGYRPLKKSITIIGGICVEAGDNYLVKINGNTLISIIGPASLYENSYADYNVKLNPADGETEWVTDKVSWILNSSTYAYMVGNRLITKEVPSDQTVDITAIYSYNGDMISAYKTVRIQNYDGSEIPYLIGLNVSGPGSINENSYGDYTATANFSDGSTQNVNTLASWSVNSIYAYMDPWIKNRLRTNEVAGNVTITLSVSYSYEGISKSASIAITILNTSPKYYIVGDNPTTHGGGTWGAVFSMSGSVNGNIFTLTVTKIGGTPWETSGYIFFKLDDYDDDGIKLNGINGQHINAGTPSVSFQVDLSQFSGSYPRSFFVLFNSDPGGFAWGGPVTLMENSN